MFIRLSQAAFSAAVLPAALLLCASCGSAPDTSSQAMVDPAVTSMESAADGAESASAAEQAASAREVPDFFAPKPWTGAFSETAVMLADTVRIEGPEGLLDHVAAASDDQYYERTAEVTAEGFRQTIRRLGPDAPEIRVRIDRWTMAAAQRVVILENVKACEVTIVAAGQALWRDVNGNIATADRLEFVGEIGQTMPVRPVPKPDASADLTEEPGGDSGLEAAPGSSSGSSSGPTSDSAGNSATDSPGGSASGAPAQKPSSDDANSANTESENAESGSSSSADSKDA